MESQTLSDSFPHLSGSLFSHYSLSPSESVTRLLDRIISDTQTQNLLFSQPVARLTIQHCHSDPKPRSRSQNFSLSHTPTSNPIDSKCPEFNQVLQPPVPPPSSKPPARLAWSILSGPLPASISCTAAGVIIYGGAGPMTTLLTTFSTPSPAPAPPVIVITNLSSSLGPQVHMTALHTSPNLTPATLL